MAAGLGFKDFTTGEVLTAADVDGYLMQGIWVFASNAARDAAVTAPAEGNFAFTKDTNSLWYYDGAAWVASGATGDIEGVTAGVGISGGGTSGTVTVTNSMATAIDAKGDLVAGTGADTFARLAVGTNGHTLVADSSTATGLKWAAPAGGLTYADTQTLAEETTSSTGYTSLTTATAVTITTGTKALVLFGAQMKNTNAVGAAVTFDVTGASSSTGSDARAVIQTSFDQYWSQVSRHFVITGLTAGSNTFTLKFRTLNGTATFDRRNITVIDLGS